VNGHEPFGRLLERWRDQHLRHTAPRGAVRVLDVEVLRQGRPGIVDVVAEMDGRLAHAVFGVRRPGQELRVLGPLEEPTLGTLEDGEGVGLVVDALHEAASARLLLGAVGGSALEAVPDVQAVSLVRDDDEAIALAFNHRYTLTVFPWLSRGPHPGAALLAGLDAAGFNHLPAPVAFWRRAGRDLGVVQELLSGASSGWALAISSLRDLIASGVSPDAAGGDFAPEALALGTMAARMHMALDRAFGREPGDAAAWVDALRPDVLAATARDGERPGPHGLAPSGGHDGTAAGYAETGELLETLHRSDLHPPAIRTHGDLHLGRTARTDHGWVLADWMPGGSAPGSEVPVFRCPLADVADLTWSLHHAAAVAASERGPAPASTRAADLAAAWEARNRRALLAAYLATPGIGGLVPADRRTVRRLLRLFELARAGRGARGAAPAH
jgi:maltokinase